MKGSLGRSIMLCMVSIAVHVINPRCACAARVTRVRVSLCLLSPMTHLTSGASVRYNISAIYSAGNGDQDIFVGFSLKPLRCRDPALLG